MLAGGSYIYAPSGPCGSSGCSHIDWMAAGRESGYHRGPQLDHVPWHLFLSILHSDARHSQCIVCLIVERRSALSDQVGMPEMEDPSEARKATTNDGSQKFIQVQKSYLL